MDALIPVMMATPKPNQICACLELFHMQSYELIYNAFIVKDEKLSTDYGSLPGFEGKSSFIPKLAAYLQKTFDQVEWSDAQGEEFSTRHEKQFSEWFKQVWTSAGGETAKIPVYFCFEKEYMVQDVITGTVMDEKEAAILLGYTVVDD